MLDFLATSSEALIWLGSIAAGFAVLQVFLRWLANAIDFDDQNRLLGSWYGYGYFHAEEREQFYRETISIKRSIWNPWRLRMVAIPDSRGNPKRYAGWVQKKGDYIYSCTSEGFRDDICFEIGVLRISSEDRHERDNVVGIHLGQSYISSVHVATSFIWLRDMLDQTANVVSPIPTELEAEKFARICSKYIELKDESFELLLRYRA